MALERAQSRFLLVGTADASIALYDLDGAREAYERGRVGEGAAGGLHVWSARSVAVRDATRVRIGGGEALGRAPVVEGGGAGRGGAGEARAGGVGAAGGAGERPGPAAPAVATAAAAAGREAAAAEPEGLADILAIIEDTTGGGGDGGGMGGVGGGFAGDFAFGIAQQVLPAPPLANPAFANPALANPVFANPTLANPALANPALANPFAEIVPAPPFSALDAPAFPSDAPLFQLTRSGPNAHRFSVSCLCWSPASPQAFVSGSFDHSVKLWDATRACAVETVELPARVYALGMSPLQSGATQGLVAVGTGNRDVGLFDPRVGSGGGSGGNEGNGGGGGGGAWRDPGPAAFSHAMQSVPRQVVTVLRGHDAGVWSLAWSPSNEHVLLTGGSDGRALVWDVRRADGCLMSLDAGAEEGAGLRRRRRHVPRAAAAERERASAASPTRRRDDGAAAWDDPDARGPRAQTRPNPLFPGNHLDDRRNALGTRAERASASVSSPSPSLSLSLSRAGHPSHPSLSLSRAEQPWWSGSGGRDAAGAARDARQAAVFRAAQRPAGAEATLGTGRGRGRTAATRCASLTDELLLLNVDAETIASTDWNDHTRDDFNDDAGDRDDDAPASRNDLVSRASRSQLVLGAPASSFRFDWRGGAVGEDPRRRSRRGSEDRDAASDDEEDPRDRADGSGDSDGRREGPSLVSLYGAFRLRAASAPRRLGARVSSADRPNASVERRPRRALPSHASLPASIFPRGERDEDRPGRGRQGRGGSGVSGTGIDDDGDDDGNDGNDGRVGEMEGPLARGLRGVGNARSGARSNDLASQGSRRAGASSSPPTSRPRLDASRGSGRPRSSPASWWDAQRLADPRVPRRASREDLDDGRGNGDGGNGGWEPSSAARRPSEAARAPAEISPGASGSSGSASASQRASDADASASRPQAPSPAPPRLGRPSSRSIVQDPFFRASRDPFTPDPFSPASLLSRVGGGGAPYALSSRARLARAHAGSVTGAVAPPHGETWLTAGTDDACRAWRAADGADLRLHFPDAFNHATKARELGYAPQARALFVPTGSAVGVYDAERGGRPLAVLRGAHFESINACVWNERCEELYTAGGDGRVVVWAPRRARGGGGTLTRRSLRTRAGTVGAIAAADDLDAWSDDDEGEAEEEEQGGTEEHRALGTTGRATRAGAQPAGRRHAGSRQPRARDIVGDDLAALEGYEDGGFL